MPATVLCIGDPHIQVANIPETDLLIERLINLATEKKPDLIVLLGDLLHEHERLHTIPLNNACEFIKKMRDIAKTYCMVGNHDQINNQQYLNENHWMNVIKEFKNVIVIDKVITETVNGDKLIFVPFVAPGRFIEALNK